MVASPLQAYHQQRCNADVPLLLQASGPRLPWMETMAQLLTDQPTSVSEAKRQAEQLKSLTIAMPQKGQSSWC
eukprot:m.8567 g.8567  ORF g.8567 m.8567 type:complete len:73 (-) comp9220_c0_seq4:367-585(-)